MSNILDYNDPLESDKSLTNTALERTPRHVRSGRSSSSVRPTVWAALLTLSLLCLSGTVASAQTSGKAAAPHSHEQKTLEESDPDQVTILTFACNAGNAGNAGLMRHLEEEAVPVGEVLENLETRYNGDEPQPIRQLVVRFEEGRIVGHEVTSGQEMRPEETAAVWDFGLERMETIMPENEALVTEENLRFVTAHVDAEAFLDAVREGEAKRAVELLKMDGVRTALVVAPIPSDEHLASEDRFTMHPAVLMLEDR